MCPVCLATAALIAGSATGTGGLTAFAARTFLRRMHRKGFPDQPKAEEVHDGHHRDRIEATESRLAPRVD